MENNEELAAKAQRLKDILLDLAGKGPVCIAYSGGLDSRFLAFFSLRCGLAPQLFHVQGPHIAASDTAQAIARASDMGLTPTLIRIDPLENPAIWEAGKNRCYECKKTIFSTLLDQLPPGATLCDGSNASDLSVFRPGKKALEELGIRSPLCEAGISKEQLRAIGRQMGFANPDQAARPCLLTRFPYGFKPSEEMIQAVARIEEFIANHPFGKTLAFRVRVPDSDGPQLHIARASLPDRPFEHLSRLQHDLRDAFPNLLGLPVEILDTLSGFYDRQ